jgi:hypothetical protein
MDRDRKKSRLEIETAKLQAGVKSRLKETIKQQGLKISDEALLDAFKDFENIAVAERRLTDPALPNALPIRLKDEPEEHEDPRGTRRKWYLRWINLAMPNRHHIAQQSLGYAPVRWEDLQNIDAVSNPHKATEFVRRSEGGKEALMKMPMALYRRIKAKQHEQHKRTMTGKALRDSAVAAAHARGLSPEDSDNIGEVVGPIKIGRDTLVSPDAEGTLDAAEQHEPQP